MLFNQVLGIQSIDKEQVKVNAREAVRAVILKKDKILMVHSNKGDYKFPGGGVEKDEIHEEALRREVEEETGYIVDGVIEKLGVFIERNTDNYEKNAVFEMISHYYQCRVLENQTEQKLDAYEAELNFCPIWISLEEAIKQNEGILAREEKSKNRWVDRETIVLKIIKSSLNYFEGL